MNCPLPNNQLNLDKLCVTCLNASCGQFQQTNATNACISGKLQASEVWGDRGYFNSLCSTSANFTNACITNLNAPNFTFATKNRATVNFSSNASYTLGSQLNFNNILDDPSNSVTLTPNMSFKAPVAGYYQMTLKVNIESLDITSGPVLGSPVANPQIFVNGVLVRELYSPFISFFTTQKVILDSLITLQAGDVVTLSYSILGGSGIQITGTGIVGGTGVEDGNSFFKIILLSQLKSGSVATCPPCPTVVVDCTSIGQSLNPCSTC